MELVIDEVLRQFLVAALNEDIGGGDVTTLATVPKDTRAEAAIIAREPMVVAGLDIAHAIFQELDPDLQVVRCFQDGQKASSQQVLMRLTGLARPILSAERVALNFLQRLSGIASETERYVAAIEGTRAKILDTRKTTPGWRRLEKYAVLCGGGQNHRMGLYDHILIKDNHLAALRGVQPNPIAAAVRQARAAYPQLKVEVEVDTFEQVVQAATAGANIILLDNMAPSQLWQAVEMIRGRAETEASGGVNLATVRAIAESGVDYISVGSLTHSAPAADIALDFAD